MRLTRWIGLIAALLAFGGTADAQKGKHSSSAGGKHPSGAVSSAHRGGHYSRSGAARAPGLRAEPRQKGSPKIAKPRSPSPRAAPTPKAVGTRDKRGRLARSEGAVKSFEKSTGHPGGWKGHIVDHIVPLACGGADAPSNMQWQTTAEAKAKDKVERKGCGRGR